MISLASGTSSDRATAALVEEYYHQLAGLAARIMRKYRGHSGSTEPHELLNQACLWVLERGPRNWQNASHFRATMCLKMRYLVLDQHRARRVRPLEAAVRDRLCSRDRSLELIDLRHDLSACRGILTDAQEVSVILDFYERLSLDAVGAVLGCCGRTASRLQQRSLRVMREWWVRH